MAAVGIDLGTTNSAVAILKGRPVVVEDRMGTRTVPSAVGWDSDLDELVIGVDAKNSPEVYNTILSVKRKMGTVERIRVGPHNWLPEEVSAQVLKLLKKQVEDKTGEVVTEAIITVPAYFNMAQKAATLKAGELAGLKVQQLLPEPSAAVMAYGPQQDEKILVYDLGGGTFDVTIIDCFAGALTTLAVTGNNFLGGDDFDRRLMDYFKDLFKKAHGVTISEDDRRAMSLLKKAAEEAKIEMSRKSGARVAIPKVLESGGRPLGLETVVKTAEFNAMIRDLIQNTIKEVEKALELAKLDKSAITTVLMVGGSTYYPLVQDTVKQFFGKDPNRSVNPDLAVALGAAGSLIQGPIDERRHVVTVGFIPEKTPEESLEVRGRTTPQSRLRVTGGASPATGTADASGEYSVQVPLKRGINALVITSVSPKEEKATMEAEPVLQDAAAVRQEEPPAPPASVLSRALSISHGSSLGGGRVINDMASVIMAGQSELPCQQTNEGFCTSRDNQQEIEGLVLEGDLPIAGLNTKLAVINLKLPPNVPEGERVVVHFTIDDNATLTAELEVPSVNRRGKVVINIKSQSEQVHLYQQVEDLYTRAGGKMRPEEKAQVEQARVAVEDLAQEFNQAREGNNADAVWDAYNRLKDVARKLKEKVEGMLKKYA
jgi:molecular chaperone DnaK (HSP70)